MTTPTLFLEGFLAAWVRTTRTHRWATFGVILAVVAAAGLVAARGLTVNTDTSGMIAADAGFREASLAFEDAFPDLGDQLVLIVEAPTPDGIDAAVRIMVDRLAGDDAITGVFAPRYASFFERNALLYPSVTELEDTLARLNEAAPLIERLNANPTSEGLYDALAFVADVPDDQAVDDAQLDRLYGAVAETIEGRLEGDPRRLSWQALFRPDDGETPTALFSVQPRLDTTLLKPARPALEAIARAEAVAAEAVPGLSVEVTGDPALRADELETVSQGIGLAFAASGVMVTILLIVAYRSLALALVTLGAIVMSIVTVGGLAAVMFPAGLNMVSVAFVVLLVGLGADFAIHLLLHVQRERSIGRSPGASLYRTARQIGAPLLLTAPTTALAFFAFVPTRFVGMAQMGIIGGVGVLVAFVLTISLMPAALSFLPAPKAFPTKMRGSAGPLTRIPWLPLLLVLTAGSLFLLPGARFDADPMNLRDPDAPSVRAFSRLFTLPGTAPYRLDVLAPEGESAALATELERLPEVRGTVTTQSFLPEDQNDKLMLLDYAGIGLSAAVDPNVEPRTIEPDPRGRLRAALANTDSPEAIRLRETLDRWAASNPDPTERAALEADLMGYWPEQLSRLRAQLAPTLVDEGDLPPDLIARYRDTAGLDRIEVLPEADIRDIAARRAFVEAVLSLAPNAAGPARAVLEAGDIVQRAMLTASGLALLLVSLLLLAVTRQPAIVGALAVTLVVAAILTTASGVVLGIPYNFANVIVLPLLIGLGVDSGIHMAFRSVRDGQGQEGEQQASESLTARAVLFSALTTMASFGSLVISPHRGTASMGALLLVAIGWTLVTSIILLPPMVRILRRNRTKPIA